MASQTQRVSSSAISFVAYDADREVLSITWSSTPRVYNYFGVPADVFQAFMAAPSKGKFANALIKGVYPYG